MFHLVGNQRAGQMKCKGQDHQGQHDSSSEYQVLLQSMKQVWTKEVACSPNRAIPVLLAWLKKTRCRCLKSLFRFMIVNKDIHVKEKLTANEWTERGNAWLTAESVQFNQENWHWRSEGRSGGAKDRPPWFTLELPSRAARVSLKLHLHSLHRIHTKITDSRKLGSEKLIN